MSTLPSDDDDQAPPARPRPDPVLLDEDDLDPAGLDVLPAPLQPAPVPDVLPPRLGDEEHADEPEHVRKDDLLERLALQDEAAAAEVDLVALPPLTDEDEQPAPWLLDDGLSTTSEADLVVATPADGPLRAGAEEHAVLVDLAGVVVPATLATGMTGSVLSAPLTELGDGRVRMRLGPETVEADPRGFTTRVRLGQAVLPVTLRLVEGPSPHLVLGRDALAGQVVVDPAARHLLDRSKNEPAKNNGGR